MSTIGKIVLDLAPGENNPRNSEGAFITLKDGRIMLVYSRFSEELALPMYGVALFGMAYNMLKAIDVLYYEYFTGEKADLEVYCNYMLFLPVLTAGPVFRYRDFQKTWARPGILTLDRFTEGVRRIIRGLFSKVVLSAIGVSLLGTLTADTIVWYESLLIPPVSLASISALTSLVRKAPVTSPWPSAWAAFWESRCRRTSRSPSSVHPSPSSGGTGM